MQNEPIIRGKLTGILTTHHGNKESQTDMLITNNRTKKTVRV
jgi:hypothetical protein